MKAIILNDCTVARCTCGHDGVRYKRASSTCRSVHRYTATCLKCNQLIGEIVTVDDGETFKFESTVDDYQILDSKQSILYKKLQDLV